MDESMITGESRPVDRGEGDRVVAGTVSSDRAIRVRVDALGDDTALAGIQRLVADAQSSNSRTQALADRAAAALFYVATGAAVMTLVVWAALGDGANGVIRTVTVLVIACPHALGLAIPLVISITTATSARAGILVKDRLALERMRTVDAVMFDKTGTLTKGNHAVIDREAIEGWDADEMMRFAAAAEADSEHPIARAIVAVGDELGDVPAASEFDAITGRGIAAIVDGHEIAVGGPALLDHLALDEPGELANRITTWRDRGGAVLYVVHDGEVVGAVTVADEIRPESRAAVDALHARGKQVIMITGDARQVADAVAAELGIDEVMAEVFPQDKDAKVAELQQRGLRVAMVGDGVNDAPALARAEVGIAIGAGTDVAIESAGVVLASSDPRAVTGVIDLSRASYRKMIQNLVWATAYNVIAIPVAAGAFAFAGLTLPPAAAAVAMSLSTIIVAANAQLLRRLDLRPRDDLATRFGTVSAMRIGEVAEQAAVTTKTIRYYESIGILPTPDRTPSGYRAYDSTTLERLRFIRDAQATGLTLTEIKSILELKGQGERSCEHTRSLIQRQLTEVDVQIHRLESARRELHALMERADRSDPADCVDAHRCQVIEARLSE